MTADVVVVGAGIPLGIGRREEAGSFSTALGWSLAEPLVERAVRRAPVLTDASCCGRGPVYSNSRSGSGSPARSCGVSLPSGLMPMRSSTWISCRACCAECQVERSKTMAIGCMP